MKIPIHAQPFSLAVNSRPSRVDLRPGVPADRAFCHQLYLACMKPLLTTLGVWDADRVDATFDRYFDAEEICVTRLDCTDIGYLQVTISDGAMNLDQFHILAQYQRRGIGTRLLRNVIAEARARGLPLRLDLIKGNPARSLYTREGFEITHSDETKHYMTLGVKKTGEQGAGQ